MFASVEDGIALLRKGGLYKMMKLYHLNGALFSWYTGGYVRLYASGATSVDKLAVVTLHLGPEDVLAADKLGRLRIDGKGTPLTDTKLIEGADI